MEMIWVWHHSFIWGSDFGVGITVYFYWKSYVILSNILYRLWWKLYNFESLIIKGIVFLEWIIFFIKFNCYILYNEVYTFVNLIFLIWSKIRVSSQKLGGNLTLTSSPSPFSYNKEKGGPWQKYLLIVDKNSTDTELPSPGGEWPGVRSFFVVSECLLTNSLLFIIFP